jgi:serine/threonine protein kinase
VNKGDVINDYEILQDFSVAGAGFSKWTFAEKDGREYFFKEFLSPTYPEADAPGSERIKARKRARCEAFENHHRRIMEATRPVSSLGGNLIVTLDFFRSGAKYYKVTEKVEIAEGPEAGEVAALGFDDQLVILKSVAHSLKVLHDLKIVHSDLKPTNILIKKTALAHTAKLIDFDSAYFTGEPPPPDQIVGTINYYSPELVTYIQDTEATDPHRLGLASDVFTLGLIYTEYLTGQPPAYDRERYAYPSIAARQGEVLRVPRDKLRPEVPPEILDLIDRMMLLDPAARPSIGEVHAALMKVRKGVPRSATPEVDASAAAAPAPTSGLKGKGLRTATRGSGAAAPAAARAADPAADRDPPEASVSAPAAAEAPATTSTPDDEERPKSSLLGKLVSKARKTD